MSFDYYNVDKELTLFYSLTTGKVKQYCSGVQSMEYFGDDKEDYNYGCLVVENNEFIIRNLDNFRVENGELVLVQPTSISGYRMSYR